MSLVTSVLGGLKMDTGEPFGLPKGTIRGLIALTLLALVGYDFVVDQQLTTDLVALAGPYLGFYFGTRSSEPAVVVESPLAPPLIGGDPEAEG